MEHRDVLQHVKHTHKPNVLLCVQLPEGALDSVKLFVEGMTCADCSAMVEDRLSRLPGVRSVKVSSLTKEASLVMDSTEGSVEALLAALGDVGFPSKLVQRRPLAEADGSHKVASALNVIVHMAAPSAPDLDVVRKRLSACEGVRSCVVEVVDRKSSEAVLHVDLEFDASAVGARALLATVREQFQGSVELRATATGGGEASGPSFALQLPVCVALTVPVVILMYLIPLGHGAAEEGLASEFVPGFAVRDLIVWLLVTPVQFWCGWPLYVSAFRALYFGRTANIDLLVMLSTTVAYLTSAISALCAFARVYEPGLLLLLFRLLMSEYWPCVFGWHWFSVVVLTWRGSDVYYFDSAAILLALVLVGRRMEAIAKRQTTDVLRNLVAMQVCVCVWGCLCVLCVCVWW